MYTTYLHSKMHLMANQKVNPAFQVLKNKQPLLDTVIQIRSAYLMCKSRSFFS